MKFNICWDFYFIRAFKTDILKSIYKYIQNNMKGVVECSDTKKKLTVIQPL